MTRPVSCLFSSAVKSITNILVKTCSGDDQLTLEMENDDGERCTTDRLKVSAGSSLENFSPGQFGEECSISK